MYINIGSNVMLLKKNITAVFDIETTTGSEITREFLGRSTKRHEVVNVTYDLPRAMVLYCEKGKSTLYVTDLSAAAIKRRSLDKDNIL